MSRDRVLIACLTLVGFLVAGVSGALTALVATLIGLRWRTLIPAYALGALVLVAVLTLIERLPSSPGSVPTFVAHRPVAASFGAVAGVLVLVSVVLFALAERESSPSRARGNGARPAAKLDGALGIVVAGLVGAALTGVLLGSAAIVVVSGVLALVGAVGHAAWMVIDRRRLRSSEVR